MALTLRLL